MQDTRRAAHMAQFDLSSPKVDLDQIQRGGPPKDGIPALNNPKRESLNASSFSPASRVIEVVIAGDAVAYPINILNWHEIVNDVVGDTPIAIVYCPLCDSVSVMRRQLTDDAGATRTLEFGVSGLLLNSNVVMFERATNALWSQVDMRAITGPDAGRRLAFLPFRMTTLAAFRAAHPRGQILSRDTGHARNYDVNPYGSYLANPDAVFSKFDYDDKLPPKTLGVGVFVKEQATFIPMDALGEPGSRRVFDTAAGAVTLERTKEGVAFDALPKGARVMQTFYHSWSAFHPSTRIVKAADLKDAN